MSKIKENFANLKLNVKFTIVILIAIVIPIAIFAGVLFYTSEQNVIETNLANMEYKIDQGTSNISTCIDSINMATQFFLSDEDMKKILIDAVDGKTLSTNELVDFKERDINNLERLVSNNPLLYSVRVYAKNDNVVEMMPILYTKSRMESLDWSKDIETNWHIGYKDKAFSSLLTNQSDELMGRISVITDYKKGEVGIVEATVKMSTIFPMLYEDSEREWSCFVTEDGQFIYGDNCDERKKAALERGYFDSQNQVEEVSYIKEKNKNLVVGRLEENELGGSLVYVKDITDEIQHVYFMRNTFVVMMILLLAIITFLINNLVDKMLSQFYSILRSIREVGHGNLDVRISQTANDEMGELGATLNKMLDRIQRLMNENIDREVMIKDSEIRALQNQINAHFIYNVLESIKMMAEIDEEYEISDSITSLGKLLRYSMRWVSGNVSVAEELDYIKNYMALINLRYDFVVNLSTNIPDNLLSQEIPKMSLQPIVENAILHGIDPLGEDSTIYIKGITDGKDTILEITDTGQGMTPEELVVLKKKVAGEIVEKKEKGNGIGLHNVQNRIKMTFGEEYGMTISTEKNCYTKVSIRLPFRKSEG